MKLTSDIASVQHWRLARKRSTPPLHVILVGSKPAPTPFLTIFTIYKTSTLLHPSVLPTAGSSKTRPRVGPHEHEGTKQRTQRNAGTGGQKACTGGSVPSGNTNMGEEWTNYWQSGADIANLLAYHSYATCCQQIHTFAQGCWQPSAFTSRLLAGHKDWCILPAASRRHTMLLDGRANRAMQPAV